MKCLLLVAVFGLAVCSASIFGSSCGDAPSHNYFFGARNPQDRLAFMDNPKHESEFLRVVSTDVTFPLRTQPTQGVINYIEIVDQESDGTGGCAYITEGGVGSTNVSIHIKSQRGYGFNFLIDIYTL